MYITCTCSTQTSPKKSEVQLLQLLSRLTCTYMYMISRSGAACTHITAQYRIEGYFRGTKLSQIAQT